MIPKYFNDLSLLEKTNFLNDIDSIIFDCDGVLWLGDVVINNSPKINNDLQNIGKSVFYISNNSTKIVDKFSLKLKRLGFIYRKDNIYITAPLIGSYVKDHLDSSKCAYVIGPEAVRTELEKRNIRSFGYGPDPITKSPLEMTSEELAEAIPLENDVGAVVVAFDDHYSYLKSIKACTYLFNPNCLFIGSNTDAVFPHSNQKYTLPGSGAIISAVELGSHRKATILGKPEQFIVDQLIKDHKIDPKRTLMVGDRCDTDILFGNRAGFKTLLVFTGVHTLRNIEELQKSNEEIDKRSIPMYYTDSVADLLPAIEAIQIKCDL